MNRWQALKIVSGSLFLLAALVIEIFVTKSRNVQILQGLLVFLGVFYILSPLVIRRIFKKMSDS